MFTYSGVASACPLPLSGKDILSLRSKGLGERGCYYASLCLAIVVSSTFSHDCVLCRYDAVLVGERP